MSEHVVQSKEWGEFKTLMGTPAVRAGGIQYTLHKLPFLNLYYAYAPKVDPANINWEELRKSLSEKKAFVCNFDVPYVEVGSAEETKGKEVFETQKDVVKSPKDTFTKYNIMLDLTPTEEDIFKKMNENGRYNIRKAQRLGVKTKIIKYTEATEEEKTEAFETFFKLLEETSIRAKFLIHPRKYYEKVWEVFGKKNMGYILIAEFEDRPVGSCLVLMYEDKLYYPYGGSASTGRKAFPNEHLKWEAIKMGKGLGCKVYDMWGASKDPYDEKDPEAGFTRFKIKFGGRHIQYIDSYDLVLNKPIYFIFTYVYPIALDLLKKVRR